jgi:TPP-dependent pyruvate/acetoin dehydrogenase alpha subunit
MTDTSHDRKAVLPDAVLHRSLADLYRGLYRIRSFEERVLAEFSRGVFSGTTHTCLGQEANAVGILSQVQPGDIVVSNHRCHGHFLAYGGDPRALFAELMGKATGVCGGRGGSQHLHWRNFYSSGILGGMAPVAAGMALAERRLGRPAVAVAFLGDGALGEGIVYETLNLASLWQAPVVFVVEHNHIAQTTPTSQVLAGEIAARFQAFGIPVKSLDTSDVLAILAAAQKSLSAARTGGAQALILETARFGPHSKGDDTRPAEEIARLRLERDPLQIHAARFGAQERGQMEQEIDLQISQAFRLALSDPFPD